MLKCQCAECGITKAKFVNTVRKLNWPSQEGGNLFHAHCSYSVGKALLKSG